MDENNPVPMTNNRYDLIVIGNDLSSLIAADAASRDGLKTLLLQEGDIPDSFTESGFTFNMDPFPWSGLGPKELRLDPYLDEIHNQFIPAALRLLDPGLQVLLPAHRIDVYVETERLIRELDREFPGSKDFLWDLYDSIWKTGKVFIEYARENPFLSYGLRISPRWIRLLASLLRERSKFLKKLRSIQQEPLLLFFEAQMSILSGLHCEGLFLPASYALSLPLQGIYYPVGGKKVAIEMIRRGFQSRGGTLSRGCTIQGINLQDEPCKVEWNAGNFSESASTGSLVVGASWKNLEAHILCDKRLRSLAKRLTKRSRSAFYPFTLHLGISEKGIPEKLSEYAILIVNDDRSSKNQAPLFIELSRRGDTERAPEGKRALSATIFIEKSPALLPDGDLQEVASCILRKLDGLFPFLAEHTEFMDARRSMAVSRTYQELVSRKYRIKNRFFAGFGVLSARTPLKNVFLTGDDLLGLGFLGDIMSGVNAVRLVCRKR